MRNGFDDPGVVDFFAPEMPVPRAGLRHFIATALTYHGK